MVANETVIHFGGLFWNVLACPYLPLSLFLVVEGMPFGGIGPSGRKPCLFMRRKGIKLSPHLTGCTPFDNLFTHFRTTMDSLGWFVFTLG